MHIEFWYFFTGEQQTMGNIDNAIPIDYAMNE